MHIELNGAPHEMAAPQTIAELVQSLALGERAVAVAVNREIVARAQWHERLLCTADRVDIVRPVGGG
jgi:sulfur carrier protein